MEGWGSEGVGGLQGMWAVLPLCVRLAVLMGMTSVNAHNSAKAELQFHHPDFSNLSKDS